MTDFHNLVENMNGDNYDYRERPLEILAAMKPAPNVRWTQCDLDETVAHIFKHVDDCLRNLLPAIATFIESRVAPLRQRIDELEHKTENFKYVGVYESGEVYREGNFCTHQGSLWHCLTDTSSPPGTDATWQLCCKRGKDAR